MKHTLRIPTKEQYAYIEVEFEGDTNEAIAEYHRLTAELKGSTPIGNFEKVHTFTGETVMYDPIAHIYQDLKGNTLVGGSGYKKLLEKPFDSVKIAPATAKKYGIETADIKDMWSRNSNISVTLGNSLHYAMEQYFLHRAHGTEKNYHLPKHPFLRRAVLSFPYKDAPIAFAEKMVSDVANRRVGQIDLMIFEDEKKLKIIDYKTDAEIEKKLELHFHQLSYYAHILGAFGYEVTGIEVWNYLEEWKCYESIVLPLVEK